MNILKLTMIVGLLLTSQWLHSAEKCTDSDCIRNEANLAVLPPFCRARLLAHGEDPSYKEWDIV